MIETERLTKRYGTALAVDEVSFTVSPGEVLGFLGPNGAGKTTTMRMIAGFIAPSAGRVRVCGHDIAAEPVQAKSCIGYLPEGAPGYGEMSVRAFLEFIADLRALPAARRSDRLATVIDQLALKSVLDQTIETLSKGFRRRVGLAQALLHDPPVLILDEPTDGLDPNQKHDVRKLINDLGKDKLVIVSTHILEEVHAVCTRAIVIAAGKILADATPRALEARSRYYHAVTLRFDVVADFAAALQALHTLAGVNSIESDAREMTITALPKGGAEILGDIRKLVSDSAWRVSELHLEAGRLDEVFRSITLAPPASAAS
jgi:ABC-2 type transport system ATP-binding protein